MKIGLVLEGGGMRGLYTAGILDQMMESKLSVDGVVGVSAGALVGVNLISQQPGRMLRYNLKYIDDPRYIGWKHLLRTGNIINPEFAFDELPFKLDVFDEEKYNGAEIPFYAVITNVRTGKAEYVNITDVKAQIDVLRASSAMPFVSKPVEINDQEYLDGGIADSIPIDFAMTQDWDKIIVILTRPQGYRKSKTHMGLVKRRYRHYPALIKSLEYRYLHYNDALDKVDRLAQDGSVFVIQPSQLISIRRLEKDRANLQALYNLGVSDFLAENQRLLAYLTSKVK